MADEINYWKYGSFDPDSVKNNPYINPEIKPKPATSEPAEEPSKILSRDDYLVLEDLVCVDANGNEFERYDRLYVRKDIERDGTNPINFTPYKAITHHEQNKHFLPSFALSCNIVASLYANRSDAEVDKVLMQYKEMGGGCGWHVQNTLVNWNKGNGTIIHYPNDSDFPSHGGNDNVNQNKRTALDFKVKDFGDMGLEDALKKKHFKNYLQSLTGLRDLSVLIDIGNYFDKSARVGVPDNVGKVETTRASWLACFSNYFALGADFFLYFDFDSRGVLSSEPR